MNNTYNSDSIKILSDIEHIRLRYGMYISDNIETPNHLLTEIIDNSIDEVVAGYSDGFEVYINKSDTDDMTYKVVDFGRGIPVGYKELDNKKVSILEALITKANSGGKFDNKAYLSSAGLNGVGSTVVNALADKMHIASVYNKKFGEIYTENSIPVNDVIYTDTDKPSGTTVEFTINKDNKYFNDNEIPIEFICNKLNTYKAFGIKNIKLFLDDKDVTEDYINIETPFDLHKHPMDNGQNAIVVDCSVKNDKGEQLRAAFNYISGSSTSYKFNGYTNYLYNKDGGGHVLAAQKAVVKAFNLFCEKRNIQKPSDMNSDYFIGLNCIVSCNVIEKSFASQTKDKLITGTGATSNYFNELIDLLADEINKQFDKKVGIVKAIIQRISDYRKERENRKELRGLNQYITINQSTNNFVRRGSVYKKLVECTSKNRDECSLYITEGDSASGAICRMRDKQRVAVLPLRGKILNVTKTTVTKVLQSELIAGIISTVGTGILDKCNIDRIRYKNIYYCADPDDEGKLIVNMVIALFVNLLPEVVKQSRLHIVVPPYYIYRDKEGNEQGVDSHDKIPKYAIKGATKIKGLGQLTDKEVERFLLSEDKNYTTVKYPDNLEEFNHILSTVEGKRNLLEDSGLLQE